VLDQLTGREPQETVLHRDEVISDARISVQPGRRFDRLADMRSPSSASMMFEIFPLLGSNATSSGPSLPAFQ
jgi:hypothetical protein